MTPQQSSPRTDFLETDISKKTLAANSVLAILYFFVLAFGFAKGNPVFFYLLIAGEVFHLWQVLTYIYTIWDMSKTHPLDEKFSEPVDVYITAAGEPVEIVRETAVAALGMEYPNFKVHILNDGYVAKKDNWQEMELMAKEIGVNCITRKTPGGAKAGNINNALRNTKNPFVVVFDADHVPHSDFLRKTMGHFADQKVAFVQSPQYYKNHDLNYVTGGAWEQQELFFGPILKGKMQHNAVTMAGTNMAIRRTALEEVDGICETNIAEDFLTGLFIHEKGWKSVYVPEVLAEGLAPEDFLSYYKQQFRWARGSLEVIFKHNPLFKSGLTWAQKIQYIASASYYLTGLVVLLNALFPLVFFFTGSVPFMSSTMALAVTFLPYIFLTIYVLRQSSNYSFTFRAVAFSLSSFVIHIQALAAVLLNKKSSFAITPKRAVEGNFLNMVIPHIAYIILVIIGFYFAISREGLNASVITNVAWASFNISAFVPFIIAASPYSAVSSVNEIAPKVNLNNEVHS